MNEVQNGEPAPNAIRYIQYYISMSALQHSIQACLVTHILYFLLSTNYTIKINATMNWLLDYTSLWRSVTRSLTYLGPLCQRWQQSCPKNIEDMPMIHTFALGDTFHHVPWTHTHSPQFLFRLTLPNVDSCAREKSPHTIACFSLHGATRNYTVSFLTSETIYLWPGCCGVTVFRHCKYVNLSLSVSESQCALAESYKQEVRKLWGTPGTQMLVLVFWWDLLTIKKTRAIKFNLIITTLMQIHFNASNFFNALAQLAIFKRL